MLGFFLVLISLGFMLFRVSGPRGMKAQGTLVRSISLSLKERLLLQRMNIYGLGALLLLSGIGHWFSLPFELLAIVAAYAVLMIPVRYHLTTTGVALNRVVFRRWDEFGGYEVGERQILLAGKPGNGNFAIRLLQGHQDQVLPIMQRFLPAQDAARRGGAPGKHSRRRRLHARRP